MPAEGASRRLTPPLTPPLLVVTLMATALFINFIDRGNLATAAADLSRDLHLSTTAYGSLLSAFYFAYVLGHLPAGALADRFGGKRVLAAGAALWSLATLLTGFASGFGGLVVLRMLLGLGESVGFTTTSKLIAANVPPERQGLANGVIGFGYLVGPAVGTLLGGLITAHYGWRPVFVVFGAVSLLWLVPWSRVRVREAIAPETSARQTSARETGAADRVEAIPLARILRQRGLWGASLGHFAGNWNWYFVLGYLPLYLERARGFSTTAMAGVLSSAYLVNALAALFAGWAIDRLVQAGVGASCVHKVALALSHLTAFAAMLAMPVAPVGWCLALLFAYELTLGLASPSYYVLAQRIAGPHAAARWVGVQNMIGNLPGVIGTVFTGVLIDAGGGSYLTAFALAGAINLLGLVGWVWIVPQVEPIAWPRDDLAPAMTQGT